MDNSEITRLILLEKITECLDKTLETYEEKSYALSLSSFNKKPTDNACHYPLGQGTYAIVVDNQNDEDVTKFAKNANDAHLGEMPFEYCLVLESKSEYIVKVLLESFLPYELDINFYHLINKNNEEALNNFVSVSDEQGNKRVFVPSYKMEKCYKIAWEDTKNITIFLYEAIFELQHIHNFSHITLLDVSSGNMMTCDGKLKFIDLGFARILGEDEIDFPASMTFGSNRSPLANLFESSDLPFIGFGEPGILKKEFYLEYEAYDFWAIGLAYIKKFCDIEQWINALLQNFRDKLENYEVDDEIKANNFSKLGLKIYSIWEDYGEQIFSKIEHCVDEPTMKSFKNLIKHLLVPDPEQRLKNVAEILEFQKQ